MTLADSWNPNRFFIKCFLYLERIKQRRRRWTHDSELDSIVLNYHKNVGSVNVPYVKKFFLRTSKSDGGAWSNATLLPDVIPHLYLRIRFKLSWNWHRFQAINVSHFGVVALTVRNQWILLFWNKIFWKPVYWWQLFALCARKSSLWWQYWFSLIKDDCFTVLWCNG